MLTAMQFEASSSPPGCSPRANAPRACHDAIVVDLPITSRTPVLALGGELKNTLCAVSGSSAFLGPAFGDLNLAQNLRAFIQALDEALDEVSERGMAAAAGGELVVAHDLHPAYLSTQCASRLVREKRIAGSLIRRIAVQHHYAHILACMAEHGVTGPVIGVACDGTGYGSDSAVWGCEVLHVAPTGFERLAHLRYYPLPGGDAAALEIWRPALALVQQAFGEDIPRAVLNRFATVPGERFVQVTSLLGQTTLSRQTSSLGRLFDAAAFLLGLAERNDEEGLAARRLEEAAGGGHGPAYPYRVARGADGMELDVTEMIRALAHDMAEGVQAGAAAGRFHATVARMLADAAAASARARGVRTVALSGGCFANRLLTRLTRQLLLDRGVERVLTHRRVSCGDAGLALGQAFCAAARLLETQ